MTLPSFYLRVVLLSFAISGLTLFAQTFSVQSVTGNHFDVLDDTSLLTCTVLLTGNSISNVVPRLTPPACSFDDDGKSYFSTSFAGVDGAGTPGPIGVWEAGTTRRISFYVHLYNQPDVCANSDSVCSQAQTRFDLSFTYSGGGAPVSASTSDLLLMEMPPSGGRMVLSPPVYAWEPGYCVPFTFGGHSNDGDFDYEGLDFDPNDPNQRVILGLDWYAYREEGTAPLPIYLLFADFFVKVSPFENAVNIVAASFAGNLDLVDQPLVSHTGVPLTNGPYGGAGYGECPSASDSINYWDITDLKSGGLNGPSVRESIAPDTNGPLPPNAIHLETSLNDYLLIRALHIYTATLIPCGQSGSVFGAPPADFRFTQSHIAEDGTTTASINVPSAWGTSVLGTGFDMEWYLRSDTVFEPIPITSPKALTVNFNLFNLIPAGADPTEFQIEARIKHDPDGGNSANASYVSTFSPLHTLGYQIDGPTYDNAEMQPDNILDPGETAHITYNLVNTSNQGLSDLELVISNPNPSNQLLYNGTPLDGSLIQSFGSMNPGQTLPILMDLSLIQVDPALICGNLELEVATHFTHDGVAQSFVDRLVLPVNCDGGMADNYFNLDPIPAVTICNSPITVVANNTAFPYQFRFYTSLDALGSDSAAEINGNGVWAQPVLPTDPEVLPLTYYVAVTAANDVETRRMTTVAIQAIDDGICNPCTPFDVNNDQTVDTSDFSLNASQNWTTGAMLDLVDFIIDSQQSGCLNP